MKVNMIRPGKSGEPASDERNHDQTTQETEALDGALRVVGDSMSGKGCDVNTGDLAGEVPDLWASSGVRAAIRAKIPGSYGGAKGGRKADPSNNMNHETESATVPRTRDKQAEEALWTEFKAERGVWSEKMLMALQGGLKGKKWFSLIDKVWSERTLQLAWEKVASNAGGCGVDNITIGHFAKDSKNRLLAVSEHLKQGTYQPKPVKRVWIPKPGTKEQRPLGIPTVTDRVVQAALRMVIEPIFEKEFAPHSYGFRPGRGCKDALRQVDIKLKEGYVHVVDVDIKGYFDSIPHDRLMELVQGHISDGRILKLIKSYLKQGVMEEKELIGTNKQDGTPQGAVISPLLANLYLNPLDWLMAQEGITMVRYADDMVMLCQSAKQAEQVLAKLQKWSEQAGLTLHPEKTKIVDMGQARSHFDFLGYRFRRTVGKMQIRRFIRPKSLKNIRQRIRPLTKRTSGRCLPSIISKLNPVLRGVHEYFHHAYKGELSRLDGWVRGRLRSILRKRNKGKGKGKGKDHFKWPNCYFDRHGLFSLEQARRKQIISLRNGANC